MVWPHQWTKWLESQAHLKGVIASQVMESLVIVVLDIGEALIPCAWILWVVHAQNMYSHLIDDLYLAISLGKESCGLSELGVQHWQETRPKCIEEPIVLVCDDILWDLKVYPQSFKEEFRSGCCCDILLVGYHNGHLRESVDEYKNTVVSMLSRRTNGM